MVHPEDFFQAPMSLYIGHVATAAAAPPTMKVDLLIAENTLAGNPT